MAHYFNYISFGNFKEIEEDLSSISMSIGRVLEYTPEVIVQRLTGLNGGALDFMKSLPTFLCSEIFSEGDTYFISVKFGSISEVTSIESKELRFKFLEEIDFGIVELADKSQAAKIFDARGGQPYRTHWAVMEGEPDKALDKLREISSIEVNAPEYSSAGQLPDEEPPLGRADSVESFLREVFEVTSDPPESSEHRGDEGPESGGMEYFFRGHEQKVFRLAPSVLRSWGDGTPKYLASEDRMNKELLIAHDHEFHADQYCFDQLVRMQHFGLPTRLLDLSGNPLIALYFACESKNDQTFERSVEDVGQVVLFGIRHENIKYYDSDMVSCVANLSKLSDNEKNEINTSLPAEKFNESASIKQLLHHVRSEKPYFEGRIQPEHIASIICVKGKRNNARIKSQHGAFLLFGHGAKMPEKGTHEILVKRIEITNKSGILAQLDKININATTVYPSIARSAEHIKTIHVSKEKDK